MNIKYVSEYHYIYLYYHNIDFKLHEKMNAEQDEVIKTKIFRKIEKYNYEYIDKYSIKNPIAWRIYIYSDLFKFINKEIINFLKNNDITTMTYEEFKKSYIEYLKIEILLKKC